MFELIISYFVITLIVYTVTRNKTASFSWPITFIKWVFEKIGRIVNANKYRIND